ncbi:MAG TPA: hypothetical protein VFV50_07890 [Bdellovibrionales bacterium]|nr:hypothetical protein [Bdellovibrionales bacterium]
MNRAMVTFAVLAAAFSARANVTCPASDTTKNMPEGCKLVRRAAFDVGSGSVKLAMADIKSCNGRVVCTRPVAIPREFRSRAVNLQRFADYNVQPPKVYLTASMRDELVKNLIELNDYAHNNGALEYVGAATNALRLATDDISKFPGPKSETPVTKTAFIDAVKRASGLSELQVISQDLEGEYGFNGARAAMRTSGLAQDAACTPEKTIAWDIGGGSIQVTTLENGLPVVDKAQWGADIFRRRVLEVQAAANIATDNSKTRCAPRDGSPNPVGRENVDRFRREAHELIRNEGRRPDPRNPKTAGNDRFAKRIKKFANGRGCIAGIGGVHFGAVYTALQDNWSKLDKKCASGAAPAGYYTPKHVRCLAEYLATKSDCDEPFTNDRFSPTNVTNLLLVLGFLDHFDFKDDQRIRALDVNMTNQLLTGSGLSVGQVVPQQAGGASGGSN